MHAPVILFVYNRIEHTQKTIEALKAVGQADQINLIIYADGPGSDVTDRQKVEQVRSFLSLLQRDHPFRAIEVVERIENIGLARSIISGVSEVLARWDRAIVLEDDIVVSVLFYEIMNKLLNEYKEDGRVNSISGYMYPVAIPRESSDFFLMKRASSWGWATWRDRWEQVDWEVSDYNEFMSSKVLQRKFNEGGEDLTPMLIKWKKGMNDSWAIRWCYHQFKTRTYGIFPKNSMVVNIGNDGTGTHSRSTKKYQQQLNDSNLFALPQPIMEDATITGNIEQFFRLSPIRKVINKLTLDN